MISAEYRELNRQLHEQRKDFGAGGHRYRAKVRQMSSWGRLPILDFGCGKATLAQSLGPAYDVTSYDPALPEYAARPEPHPVVIAGDMLEHVEPEFLDNVLADLWRVTIGKGLFVIHLKAAKKTLPDGRNTHLIQKPADWWAATLARHGFRIIEGTVDRKDSPNEAVFVVERAVQ